MDGLSLRRSRFPTQIARQRRFIRTCSRNSSLKVSGTSDCGQKGSAASALMQRFGEFAVHALRAQNKQEVHSKRH